MKFNTSFRFVNLFILILFTFGLFSTTSYAADKFVAVVITGDLPRYKTAHDSFVNVLKAGGLTDEKVEIYVQTPSPNPMSWINSIRKAVGIGADLIVTYGAPATLAAKKEARGVPVLFADVYDPVSLGIVKTLSVTGADITGVSGKTPLDTLVKTYFQIHAAKTVGALFSSDDDGSAGQVDDLVNLGPNYGFTVIKSDVKKTAEIKSVLENLLSQCEALFVSESALLDMSLNEIMAIAKSKGIPVLSQTPGLSDLGAIVTLETDPIEQGQLAGVHALQILSGQKAHTLPVRTPKKVSLVINMKVAQEMNMTVPFQALSMATRVIK